MKGVPSSPLAPASWIFFLSEKSGLRSGRALVPGEEWVGSGQGMGIWAGGLGLSRVHSPADFWQ